MAKYSFTVHERWAVFKAHGEQCYLGREPIDLKTMQVDHIIPESLADDRVRLAEVLTSMGLPMGFDLNSYENWMPSCGPCNNRKRAMVFEPTPIILVEINRAREAADECRRLASQAVRNADIAKALTYLERALDQDQLDYEKLKPLILAFAKADPDAWEALTIRKDPRADVTLGLLRMPEFRISPNYKVLFTSGSIRVQETPVSAR